MEKNRIKEFIDEMKKSNIEVERFRMITENMLKRIFSKNREKIEEVLLIMKQGEKYKW